jgi:hypothetical protein
MNDFGIGFFGVMAIVLIATGVALIIKGVRA